MLIQKPDTEYPKILLFYSLLFVVEKINFYILLNIKFFIFQINQMKFIVFHHLEDSGFCKKRPGCIFC